MTINEIIALISNPATIADGLAKAVRVPFTGADRALFDMKRSRFSAGMTDYERLNWIQEMIVFLQPYAARYGGYQSDLLNRWHHFDKRELKRKFDRLRRSGGNLKILFIEYDNDPLSYLLHEILQSYHNSIEQTTEPAGAIKGGTEYELDLSDHTCLDEQWSDFMRSVFGLSRAVSVAEVADGFKEKKLGIQSHFVVQKIYKFNTENFERYYALWQTLTLEAPHFLFFYVDPDVLQVTPSGDGFLACPCSMHSLVQKDDFARFFASYGRCYKEDLILCQCEPMPFREALERLEFCEKEH